MTNKEIRDRGVNGMAMNGNYFVNQDFNDDFVANDTEGACDYALDYLMEIARQDERERVIKEIDLPQILIRLSKIKQCGTCARCEEMLDYIISKLNQLK